MVVNFAGRGGHLAHASYDGNHGPLVRPRLDLDRFPVFAAGTCPA